MYRQDVGGPGNTARVVVVSRLGAALHKPRVGKQQNLVMRGWFYIPLQSELLKIYIACGTLVRLQMEALLSKGLVPVDALAKAANPSKTLLDRLRAAVKAEEGGTWACATVTYGSSSCPQSEATSATLVSSQSLAMCACLGGRPALLALLTQHDARLGAPCPPTRLVAKPRPKELKQLHEAGCCAVQLAARVVGELAAGGCGVAPGGGGAMKRAAATPAATPLKPGYRQAPHAAPSMVAVATSVAAASAEGAAACAVLAPLCRQELPGLKTWLEPVPAGGGPA